MQEQRARQSTASKVLLALPLLAIAHIAYYWPLLPTQLASHFGPDGRADGWMSKLGFAVFHVLMTTFFSLLFAGMGLFLEKMPNEVINLPNKDYWLAPERRNATIGAFSTDFARFGVAVVAFMFAITQTIILSNLRGADKLGPLFFVYLFAFLAYTAYWTVQMTQRYKLPRES